jgi:hypothetical protein
MALPSPMQSSKERHKWNLQLVSVSWTEYSITKKRNDCHKGWWLRKNLLHVPIENPQSFWCNLINNNITAILYFSRNECWHEVYKKPCVLKQCSNFYASPPQNFSPLLYIFSIYILKEDLKAKQREKMSHYC